MEQHRTQEHIATLCAAGTLGIAATGFALASETYSADAANKTDSNWTRTDRAKYSSPNQSGPVQDVATPVPSTSNPAGDGTQQSSRSASLFGKRRLRELRPGTATGSDTSESRGSSLHRGISLRPRTADTRSTSERRDPSTGSSWLKRISTISTATDSSPTASVIQDDGSSLSDPSLPPIISRPPTANKLIKRSTSRREFPDGQRRPFLQRPATSHQRSVTMREVDHSKPATQLSQSSTIMPPDFHQTNRPPVTWRPYFVHGYPKKRHSIGALNESTNLRTIPNYQRRKPTLMLGPSVGSSGSQDISQTDQQRVVSDEGPSPSGRNRLRRSLSSIPRFSRRRYFTDPIGKDVYDPRSNTTSSPAAPSPISPLSSFSVFDVDMPSESPVLGSSPPISLARPRFSFRKKDYNTQSDPTTISSDNDTRIFSDDDSVDFQSDTAFDSLATRATVYSQRTAETRKVDTIFADQAPVKSAGHEPNLANLMHNPSTEAWPTSVTGLALNLSSSADEGNFDTDLVEDERTSLRDKASLQTPVRSAKQERSDPLTTPILLSAANPFAVTYSDDFEDIDWSPQSDTTRVVSSGDLLLGANLKGRPSLSSSPSSVLAAHGTASPPSSAKRLSIFDWSENHRTADSGKGREIRPKTVHGKQPHESLRSRSSGRKTQNQLHLRSQSVPSNREHQTDPTHSSTFKYGTWGLGHKPVSEEWSDDFEFDDVEESIDAEVSIASNNYKLEDRASMRGVKVPQAIIDRQASVHVQFGQVQEFMLLVEELKRLRTQGVALNLLEGHSKVLWDDAESIINLATINDEDEDLSLVRPRKSSTSDIFSDDTTTMTAQANRTSKTSEQNRKQAAGRQSISGLGIPLPSRPRGDSLAQAKSFLQTIHQSRGGPDSSPGNEDGQPLQKFPFDTQDLKDLVVKSGAITRALKDIVRTAEGVSVSPTKQSMNRREPAFSQIFNTLEESSSPPLPATLLP